MCLTEERELAWSTQACSVSVTAGPTDGAVPSIGEEFEDPEALAALQNQGFV
jgi:hypothetical protein